MSLGLGRTAALLLVLGCGSGGSATQSPKGESQPQKGRPQMPRQHGNPIAERPALGKEPRVVFDTEFHEFGEVDEGPEYETEFRFKNDGKGDLKILGEVRHCGCADTWYEVDGRLMDWGEAIPPGKSGIVHFVLKTTGFANDKPSQVDLLTNDPARPPALIAGNTMAPFGVIPLRIHANIHRQYAVEPSNAISLGAVYNMDSPTYTLRVRSLSDKPIEVLGVEPNDDSVFRAKVTSENPNKTSWKVDVTIQPGLTPQTITKTFKLLTKPELPNSTVYLLGTIRGAVEVDPSGLLPFGLVDHGRAALRQVTITNKNSSLPLAIQNLRVVDARGQVIEPTGDPRSPKSTIADHLGVTVLETKPGQEAKISIELRDTMPAGPGNARISFETGIPAGPATVAIPASWIVR